MCGTNRVFTLHAQLVFEWSDEGTEEFDLKTLIAADESSGNDRINKSGEHQRTHPGAMLNGVDAFSRLLGLFNRIDKRNTLSIVTEVGKLREDGMSQRFGCNSCTVAYDKNRTPVCFGGGFGLLFFLHGMCSMT